MARSAILALCLLVLAAAAQGSPPEAPGTHVSGAAELSAELRRRAMRTAVVGYGTQEGLAERGREIDAIVERFAPRLARVFRFGELMIREGGFTVQPPVIAETRQAFRVDRGRREAASAARHLRIVRPGAIVPGPPDWRDFLVRRWAGAQRPASLFDPRDEEEERLWRSWRERGREQGRMLADRVFAADLDRLTGFFEGLVLWHRLHRERMVSRPLLARERTAVSGGGGVMRVDESRLVIAAPAAFVLRPDLWRLP